jgi:hypothetical protein
MEVPKKLKIELPYDSAIPLLSIYPKECKSAQSRVTCPLMFMSALFTIASYAASVPINQGMEKKIW